MPTIALEFVPPDVAAGSGQARAEAAKAKALMEASGIADRVNTLLVPGMIHEDSDRPIPLNEKMDPLEAHRAIAGILPVDFILTQVTAFHSTAALGERLEALRSAGIRRVVFVGVPRTLADGEGPGVTPADALSGFREEIPDRGVILIPTRPDEKTRFEAKLKAGANFALSQMLFSDHVARLVPTLEVEGPRPEILLSFGYVPRVEQRIGLICWLIRDETDQARREMAWVQAVSDRPFVEKKVVLLDLYKRVTDGMRETGYPIGVHFECPYGFNPYAFEVFQAMLDHWSPAQG
jgi:hypothetical protein